MKKIIFLTAILSISAAWAIGSPVQQKFDKTEFYAVMKSGGLDAIDKELAMLYDVPANERGGYEGALLMKKAGLQRKAKDKLRYFKQGRIKLETALAAHNDNVEFHFLRLAIEEHAPRIVKYKANISNDKTIVVENFKNLSPAVQHAILDYCSNSKVLHKEDF